LDTLKEFYFHKYLKNILIILPFIFSKDFNGQFYILNLLIGFFIFCLINYVVYTTNDYLDRKIDKKNKLKTKKNINKEKVIFLNSFMFLLLFFMFLLDVVFFNFWIVFYLVIFYLYTFSFKFIKYLDLICLPLFYLIRCFFGAEIMSIKLSLGFIFFFFSQFLTLALIKRITQIKVNKLSKNNSIIAYSNKDIQSFYILIIILFLISCFVLLIYLHNNLFFFENKIFLNSLNLGTLNNNIVFFVYSLSMIRMIYLSYLNKINKDIFDFVINDKISQISVVLLLTIILISWK
jgi:4-hydroxybenzoate polyprenyltransferase